MKGSSPSGPTKPHPFPSDIKVVSDFSVNLSSAFTRDSAAPGRAISFPSPSRPSWSDRLRRCMAAFRASTGAASSACRRPPGPAGGARLCRAGRPRRGPRRPAGRPAGGAAQCRWSGPPHAARIRALCLRGPDGPRPAVKPDGGLEDASGRRANGVSDTWRGAPGIPVAENA